MILNDGGAAVHIVLDRRGPIPLYHQLFEQFAAAIQRGDLRPGHVLEREDLLAERLQIARPTLRRALCELATLGLISRSRGHGTIVTERPAAEFHEPSDTPTGPWMKGGPGGFGALQFSSRRAGQNVPGNGVATGSLQSRILRFEADRRDPAVAAEFGLADDARLVHVERVLLADGRPVSLHREWLPAALVDVVYHDLTSKSFYGILREVGHAVVAERRTFDARPADSTESITLVPAPADFVFTVCGLAYDGRGTPVLRTTATYLRESDQYPARRRA